MAVFVNNLDDFIAPSQECVNPFFRKSLDTPTAAKIKLENDISATTFELISGIKPDLIKTSTNQNNDKIARVSLSDCLACSGCVTSAEAVLIQEQGYEKLLANLKRGSKFIVISISTQSRASLATQCHMSSMELFTKLSSWLKMLGVKYVLDTSCAGDVSLIEAREEFLNRYLTNSTPRIGKPMMAGTDFRNTKLTTTDLPLATSAITFDKVTPHPIHPHPTPHNDSERPPKIRNIGPAELSSHIPMLSSTCPGWVCYAEKSHPEALPLLCTTKSAQQILGSVFKGAVGPELCRVLPQDIYHVTVMPCFDKKLEASRKDFVHDDGTEGSAAWTEVDLVLSTAEFWNMLVLLTKEWSLGNNGDLARTNRGVVGGDVGRCQSNDGYGPTLIDDGGGEGCTDGAGCGSPSCANAAYSNLLSPEAATSNALSNIGSQATSTSAVTVEAVLRAVSPDPIFGCDDVERLFRAASSSGESLVLAADSNSASGGYLEHISRYVAQKIFEVDLWDSPLQYQVGRNPDIAEVTIYPDSTGNKSSECNGERTRAVKPLRFARAYGFRNIQSVVQSLRRGKCNYDFVEIMACPSGCLNGGGQLKRITDNSFHPSTESPAELRERLSLLEKVFYDCRPRQPQDSPLVQWLYTSDRLGSPLSDRARDLLHTRFHVVPKLETYTPMATKW